jgi:hypothetical protein
MTATPTQSDLAKHLETMPDVFELEKRTRILANDSYVLAYPHLLSYFSPIADFSAADFVRGAHMVYGWMPTILDLHSDSNVNFQKVADLLTTAKRSGALTDSEIEMIAALVNNSFVGASKLLHFVVPDSFAIWDSKIYSYVFNERPYNHRVNQVSKYRFYLNLLDMLTKDKRFGNFHESVNRKLNYEVTQIRALEIVMFMNAPILGG